MKAYSFLAIWAAILVGGNIICWNVGVGPSHTDTGTEVERFFGWPACYRAELWTSSNPGLSNLLLRTAPFFRPHELMVLKVRKSNWSAGGIDVGFVIAALVFLYAIAVWLSGERSAVLTARLAIAGAVVAGLWLFANKFSAHL